VAQAPAPADPLFLRAVAMKYNLAEEAAKTAAVARPAVQPAVAAAPAVQKASAAVPAPSTNYLQLSGYLPPPTAATPAASGQQAGPVPALPTPANTEPAPPRVQLGLPQ